MVDAFQVRKVAAKFFQDFGVELREDNILYDDKGKAVAKYNGYKLTESSLQFLVKTFGAIEYCSVTVEIKP